MMWRKGPEVCSLSQPSLHASRVDWVLWGASHVLLGSGDKGMCCSALDCRQRCEFHAVLS